MTIELNEEDKETILNYLGVRFDKEKVREGLFRIIDGALSIELSLLLEEYNNENEIRGICILVIDTCFSHVLQGIAELSRKELLLSITMLERCEKEFRNLKHTLQLENAIKEQRQ